MSSLTSVVDDDDVWVIGVGGAIKGRRASSACLRILSIAFRSHSAIWSKWTCRLYLSVVGSCFDWCWWIILCRLQNIRWHSRYNYAYIIDFYFKSKPWQINQPSLLLLLSWQSIHCSGLLVTEYILSKNQIKFFEKK